MDAAKRAARAAARLPLVALAAATVLAACDDESLMPPPEPAAGAMFQTYVALGASITAGFESGGINDSTQMHAYPYVLAQAMGLDVQGGQFSLPLLQGPGCPPPYTDILAGERVAAGTDETCAFRETPIPEDVHDVAVPGAEIGDFTGLTGSGTNSNPLTQFILGGRTQLEAAADADPTFVTAFLGAGDILDGLREGDPAEVTAVQDFNARLGEVVNRLAGMDLEGAALIGVPNLLAFDAQGRPTFAHLSLGAAYFQASQSAGWPSDFNVSLNCAPESVFPDGQPGDQSAVPFGYGFGELFAQAQQGQSVTLDCLNDDPVLTLSEAQQVGGLIAQFNQAIATAADDNGWAFVDLTPKLISLRDSGAIPPFPTISDPTVPLMGTVYSQDGIHLTASGHGEFAAAVAQAINDAYGTDLSVGGG